MRESGSAKTTPIRWSTMPAHASGPWKPTAPVFAPVRTGLQPEPGAPGQNRSRLHAYRDTWAGKAGESQACSERVQPA